MERKRIIGTCLNLLTGVGGHFYLGRPYRAVIVLIAALTLPFLVPWLYVAYSETKSNAPELVAQHWAYASVAAFFLVFVVSAIVTLLSAPRESEAESTGMRSTAAVLATLFLAAGAGLQIWTVSNLGTVASTSAVGVAESIPPSQGKRFKLGWGGDYVLEGGSELAAGDGVFHGRLLLDGEPLVGAKARFFEGSDNFTPWMTTGNDGGFTQPLAVANYDFQALDVVSANGLELERFHIMTGRESPFGGDDYGSWDAVAEGGLFVQLLADGAQDPLVIDLVSMMAAERTDFSTMPSAEFEVQALSWPRVERAERYVVNVRRVDGEKINRLLHRELSEPSLPFNAIAEQGNGDPVQGDYFVDIYAFTANGKLVNHSSGGHAEQLMLPEGWVMRDLYQTPCEQRAAQAEVSEDDG